MQLQSTQGRASIEPRATDCRLGRAREGEMRDARCEMRDAGCGAGGVWQRNGVEGQGRGEGLVRRVGKILGCGM